MQIDLIKDKKDLNIVRKLIYSINSVGDILVTTRSQIKQLFNVLYLRAYEIIKPSNFDMLLKQNKKGNGNQIADKVEKLINVLDKELGHEHDHQHDHDDEAMICAHDANIKSIGMTKQGQCVDLEKVDNFLSELLWSDKYEQTNDEDDVEKKKNGNDEDVHKMNIYRMKAILPVKGGANHHLSVVQDLYEIEEGNTKWNEECLCKLVVIGKHLDEEVLQKGFNTIFSD